ncbi:MAG: hybrid sensor histidine kinase/response regulator [Candidatus Neomarinimicrobiota bacterium]
MQILRTLVVDDELGMRLGIQKALSRYKMQLPEVEEEIGFVVEMAESAEEAIEKINAGRPDILLLDYKLPSMSGLDLLEQINVQESEMVTIMVTAYASLETAITAIKKGAFDFLAKPFEPDELRKSVKKAAQNLILARQVRRLEQEKHQVRFQFISVLGHELKSPLNAIEGYLNIIHERVAGSDLKAYDQMVDRSIVRIQGMKKMIADLLDLTRIESGQKKREIGACDLRALAQTAIETALPAANERGIIIELLADEPVVMSADPSEIEIVLNNLISNAVKYNRDSGKVRITLKKDAELVKVSVSDTGIGMNAEESAVLFKEFVRIKNDKTRHISGSGLGLSIVKKIAALYNGDVTVTSQPDVGTTFNVHLNSAENRPLESA